MDKYIGKVLDGRYEILEIIGVGGMSVVYKAHCNRLNRYVAVKILKDELFADESLRKQFHDESQSVALLSHPNIVSVYDVSHYENVEYIVMELIDGITLKDYLQRRGALPWKEVTFFSLQIAKALEHAHSRGIIHRDIKPQNMMLLRDGTLKVTDFGIAKNADQQGTKTIGEAIGSVHYVSPEQAKGSVIDARSDVYSFGVVMYEMLTGRLPFEGESPVSIAIQHINSIALPPSDFVDNIPVTLEAITMKAMNPSLSKRYASASDVLHDLDCFRTDPYFVLPADDVQPITEENARYETEDQQTVSQAEDENIQQDDVKVYRDKEQPTEDEAKDSVEGTKKIELPASSEEERESVSKSPKKRSDRDDRRKKSAFTDFLGASIFVLIAVIMLIAAVVFFLVKIIEPFGTTDKTRIEVPWLIGQYYEDVINDPNYYEFNIKEGEYLYNDEYEKGQIIDQSPDYGRTMKSGSEIIVTISRGSRAITLRDYTGMDYKDAEREISQRGIMVVLEGVYSSEVAVGKVIHTRPEANSSVTKNDTVTIVYCVGKAEDISIVPDLLGLTEAQALDELTRAGLYAGKPVYLAHDTVPEGQIFYQSVPADTTVDKGSEVFYHISTGPDAGTTDPGGNVGSGTSYDPYPDSPRKRTQYFDVSFINASGPITITVMVNSYVEYEGVHYSSEGHVLLPLTAYEGYNTVTVIQNDKTTYEETVKFE